MKQAIESFRLFKYWVLYLLVFVVLFILYLLISAQVAGEPAFPDLVSMIGFPVLIVSVIVGVFDIIFAIHHKKYQKIWLGIGILTESFLLFVGLLVVSLSQIF